MKTKKRNPADATMRNINALKRRMDAMERRIDLIQNELAHEAKMSLLNHSVGREFLRGRSTKKKAKKT